MMYLNQFVLRLYQTCKNSGQIIDLVIDFTIDISKYNHLAGSSYDQKNQIIQKRLILMNVLNSVLVRCVHPADPNLRRI